MLRLSHLLDVRENGTPSIRRAVRIPVSQLSHRVHELPVKGAMVAIASTGNDAEEASTWFRESGRQVITTTEFEFGESPPSRLWSPNEFLEDCLPDLPVGSAIDLGCGTGRDSVHMASLGWSVTAIDRLEDALDLGRGLERNYLTTGNSIQWKRMDLDRVVDFSPADLVCCFFYLSRPLLSQLDKILNPNGYLIAETFTSEHRERFGKPRSLDRVLTPNELRTFADGLEIIRYEEGWHEGRHTARMLARR